MEVGMLGQISLLLFILGFAFAGLIHFQRRGLHHRLAFLPYALLPAAIAIFWASYVVVRVNEYNDSHNGLDEPVVAHWEIIKMFVFGCVETIVLLGLSAILFATRRGDQALL